MEECWKKGPLPQKCLERNCLLQTLFCALCWINAWRCCWFKLLTIFKNGFSKLKLILCEIIAPQCKFEFIKILVPLCAPCVLSEEIVKLLTIILPSFYCSPKKAIFSLFQAKMSSDQHGLGMQKGKILNDKYISNFSCGVLRYLTLCYCYVLCTLSSYWVLDYAFALNILIVYIFSSCYAWRMKCIFKSTLECSLAKSINNIIYALSM